MNANVIAKSYCKLTPRERLPLLVAAKARGDDAEHSRLMQSAGRIQLAVPDHFPLAMAFRDVAALQHVELLTLAAAFFGSFGKPEPRYSDLAMVLGYAFKVKWTGWVLFCDELRIDPKAQFRSLLPFDLLEIAIDETARAVYSAEQAERFLREKCGHATPKDLRPADELKAIRAAFNQQARFWGQD